MTMPKDNSIRRAIPVGSASAYHRGRIASGGLKPTLCVALLALLAASSVGAPLVHAQQPAPADAIRGDEITPELEKAVARGLEYLAKNQQADGSAGGSGFADTGITALAGVAFMAGGNLPGRGKYGENVQRCLDYVLKNAQDSGLLAENDGHGVMYSHGFATLFLAEVYGMTGDENVRERLQKAVRLIQQSQNAEGGWRYTPAPLDADVSVTICQVMALRAARDAGIKVEKQVIDRAIEYVKKCQNTDGGFNYVLGQGGGSMFPRSAAGVATLYYAGMTSGDEIERGLKYLDGFKPGGANSGGGMGSHYFYGHYYAVQTMFLAGGEHWKNWFPAIRAELLESQNDSTGSWTGEVSDSFCTSMALIILQMPNRYLPVFSGKGPGS
jgi:hypothetical protein